MPSLTPLVSHRCSLPTTLALSRPSTPVLRSQASSCPSLPQTEATAFIDAEHDARKAAWAEELRGPGDRKAIVRRLVASVEALHGKPNQTAEMGRVLQALLAEPRVKALLASQPPAFRAATVEQAAGFLNLGEVYAPCALYLAPGRPSDAARANFAQRPLRAAQFVAQFGLANEATQQLLQQFHVNQAGPRPLGSELLDISERIAAMRAERPGRSAMPAARVAAILRSQAEEGIFSAAVVDVATEHLEAGLF